MLGSDSVSQRIIYQSIEEGVSWKRNIYAQDVNTEAPAEYIGYHMMGDEWLRWADGSYRAALFLPSPYATRIDASLKRGQLVYVDITEGEHFPISHPDDVITQFFILPPR